VNPSPTRNNLRYCSLDGILATPWSVVSVPGSFLMASLLHVELGIPPLWFGVVVGIPALANALAIGLVPLVGRFLSVREMTLNMAGVNVGIWMSGVLGILFLPGDQPLAAGQFFVVLFLLLATSNAVAGVGWTSWVVEFIPDRIRGRYMARRNVFTNLSSLTFMVVSLILLSVFPGERWMYATLISLAVGARAISVLFIHRIVSPKSEPTRISGADWFGGIRDLRREKDLIRFIAFGSVAGFGMGFLSPVVTLYSFEYLEVRPAMFTALAITATLAGTASVRVWGELTDRHGGLPVLLICAVAWRFGDLGWLLATPNTRYVLFAVWTWGGIMGTGYALSSFILLLKLVPDGNRSAAVGMNMAFTSILAAAAPVLAGVLLARTAGFDLPAGTVYRYAIGLGLAICLLAILLLWGIREPRTSASRNTIYGALRTMRQLAVQQGLTFFGNNVFVARKKRRP
jgi:MFS family permease